MGNTWEVYIWKEIAGRYQYELVYAGENRTEAMREARKQKKAGIKCVRIEWR